MESHANRNQEGLTLHNHANQRIDNNQRKFGVDLVGEIPVARAKSIMDGNCPIMSSTQGRNLPTRRIRTCHDYHPDFRELVSLHYFYRTR